MGRGFRLIFWGFLLAAMFLVPPARGVSEEIDPEKERDFLEGKSALDEARKAWAEKHAPEPWMKAKELLAAAADARSRKDWIKFSQASRLARAYAELAKASAELRAEEENRAAVREELRKAEEELTRLKKSLP